MDEADQAKNYESRHRDMAIKHALAKARTLETPCEIAGVRYCVDCCDPIPHKRLKALPHAVRCLDCEQLKERRHGL